MQKRSIETKELKNTLEAKVNNEGFIELHCNGIYLGDLSIVNNRPQLFINHFDGVKVKMGKHYITMKEVKGFDECPRCGDVKKVSQKFCNECE